MGNFRVGQVADAISGGLDLFIGRNAEKERMASERAWTLQLEEIREKRAQARSDQEFFRSLALSTRSEVLSGQREERQAKRADERAASERTHREEMAGIVAGSRREEMFYDMVAKRREKLQDTLLELREMEDKQLEKAFNPEQREKISLDFAEERDRAVGSFALSMIDEARRNPEVDAFAPYRVRNKGDLQSILEQAGMSGSSASTAAEDMIKWQMSPVEDVGSGGEDSWKPSKPPYIVDPKTGRSQSNPAYTLETPEAAAQPGAPAQQVPTDPRQLFNSAATQRPTEGMGKYGWNPNYDPFSPVKKLFGDQPDMSEEDLYTTMGRRPGM